MTLGGDLMFNGVRPGPQVFQGVSSVLKSSSEVMANLEVPITDSKHPTERKSLKEIKARSQFILRADPKHRDTLLASGITFVSQANNHCMDYGAEGLSQESAMLDSLGILHAGAGPNVHDAERAAVRKVTGRPTVGLLSVMAFATTAALRKTSPATDRDAGIAVLNFGGFLGPAAKAKLARRIAVAHDGCDILVVGIHWGVERKPLPNGYQVALGRALVDAGADVVWGHHPHVLEGAELYKGKPIFYSTGNFVSALPSDTGLFRLRFDDKQVQAVEFLPARIRGGRVALLSGSAATKSRANFRQLCRSLAKHFPCQDSQDLF
jgi:poly-gamma-glutamate synthesis protein (capsule biosynthesis protein)